MSEELPAGLEQMGEGESFLETICAMLEAQPLFSKFPHTDLLAIARWIKAYEAPAETLLFREGEQDGYLCFLVDGSARVTKEHEAGGRELATVRKGKTIGEMSFIDNLPHSASVSTAEPCTLLFLTKRGFAALAEEQPRVALKLLWKITALISHRLRQTSGRLVDFL